MSQFFQYKQQNIFIANPDLIRLYSTVSSSEDSPEASHCNTSPPVNRRFVDLTCVVDLICFSLRRGLLPPGVLKPRIPLGDNVVKSL